MDAIVWLALALAVLLILVFLYFYVEGKREAEKDKQHRLEKWKQGEDVTEDNSPWWW